MAGDWIKVRTNLWDDPRVSRLCDLTGSTEAAVIGALYWLWSAADQHTEDGIMRGLTTGAIDRKTGVKGIGDALCDIGWLADHPEGVRIIHFDEHNGTSAKTRAVTAKRVAKHKSLTQAPLADQHETVSSALPREEKRREDTNKPPLPPKGEFERFWKAYPRKVGKDAAQRAFDKRRPTAALVDDMVAAIERQCRSDAWTKDGGQFIPHPTTWLNQGRWNDEAPVIHIPTPLDRGPDPELERIKRDAAQATPMPSFVKELAAQLTGKAH